MARLNLSVKVKVTHVHSLSAHINYHRTYVDSQGPIMYMFGTAKMATANNTANK